MILLKPYRELSVMGVVPKTEDVSDEYVCSSSSVDMDNEEAPLDLRVNCTGRVSPARDSGTESDDTEEKLMLQECGDIKPFKKSLIKRFDKEQNNYLHQLLSRQRTDLQHPSLCEYGRRKSVYPPTTGSLPPSPADSGVSDVDSSSSGHTSTDELKARLQPAIHSTVGTLFSRHPLSWSSPSHHGHRPPNHMSQQFYQPFATSESGPL
nr:unnamed protein product [Callosobruchus chinensis]